MVAIKTAPFRGVVLGDAKDTAWLQKHGMDFPVGGGGRPEIGLYPSHDADPSVPTRDLMRWIEQAARGYPQKAQRNLHLRRPPSLRWVRFGRNALYGHRYDAPDSLEVWDGFLLVDRKGMDIVIYLPKATTGEAGRIRSELLDAIGTMRSYEGSEGRAPGRAATHALRPAARSWQCSAHGRA